MHPGRRRLEPWKNADGHKQKSFSRKNNSTYKDIGQTLNRPRYPEFEKRHEYMRNGKYGKEAVKHAVTNKNIQLRRGIFPFKRKFEGDSIKYSDSRAVEIRPTQRRRENTQQSCDRPYWIPRKEIYEPINNQRCSTCPDTFQRDFHYQMEQKRWKFSHGFSKRKFDHDDKLKSRSNWNQYVHQRSQKRRPSYRIKQEPFNKAISDRTKSDSFSCVIQTRVDLQRVKHAAKDSFPENMVFGDFDEKLVKEEEEFLKNSEEGCFKQEIMEDEISEQSEIGKDESSKRDWNKQEQKVANYPLDLSGGFPSDLRFSRHGNVKRLLQQNVVQESDQNNNTMDKLYNMPRHSPRVQKQGQKSEIMIKQELQLSQNEDTEIQSTTVNKNPLERPSPHVVLNKINCTEETSVDKYCFSSGVGFRGNSLVHTQESQRKQDEKSIMVPVIKENTVNDLPSETAERLNSFAPGDPRMRTKLPDRFSSTFNQTLAKSSNNISTSLSKTQHSLARVRTKRQSVPQLTQLEKSKPKLSINEIIEKYETSIQIYGLGWVMDLLSVDDEALEKRENEAINKAPDPLGWCVPHEGFRACQQQRKNLVARREAFSEFTEESLKSTKKLHMRIPQNNL